MELQYAAVTPEAVYVREQTNLDFLNGIQDELQSGNVKSGMSLLTSWLYESYTNTSSKEWELLVEKELFRHPLKDLILQDPLTARSLAKPRGYAGDAKLLDMIYFPEKVDLCRTPTVGKKIFHFTSHSTIAKNLRYRKKLVAQFIDAVAEKQNLRVLSVASGHGREIELLKSTRNRKLSKFICLDQDKKSLKEIEEKYGSYGIDVVESSIVDIINGRTNLDNFNLIYSSGLCDYLSTRLAKKLTTKLYNLLLSGGKLILFNINPFYEEIGYFESFMKWSLIGRNEGQLLEFADGLPSHEVASINLGYTHDQGFNYIEITKN